MRFIQLFLISLFFMIGASVARADGEGKKDEGKKDDQAPPTTRRIVISRRKEGEGEPDPKDTKGGDEGLRDKALKDRKDADDKAAATKHIEGALQFNMSVDDFVKKNSDLLPAETVDILKLANKENYDTALDKSKAIKVGLIQSFFSVQANIDALTAPQRRTLDDYLKLTNTGRQEKAPSIYENILEPALETQRKVKRAEELGRSRAGYANGTDSDNAYRDKLTRGSRKTYLGEKEA